MDDRQVRGGGQREVRVRLAIEAAQREPLPESVDRERDEPAHVGTEL